LITQQRTPIKFAKGMRHIIERYPEADVIRIVLDQFHTHKAASRYAAFPPEEACPIVRKRELHYTPNTGAGSTSPKSSGRCSRTPAFPAHV